ncbi:MAG: molybdopterin cofactor biosynthesis protein A MobA1 [Promethearchaeota archaeon CR_4]|nr:MAG: molybdopterin cofactor biosynthesis protein A MobA1 [Candidatus Lokiarchaeota archaeon CR_4]
MNKVFHLRVAITPKCNYNCVVCDHEGMLGIPKEMPLEDLVHLINLFVEELGISRIKLTGGEPLCSPDIVPLIRAIKSNPAVTDLSLTTNGSLLAGKAAELKNAGLDRLNVSIWSLDPIIYKKITNSDALPQVLRGLEIIHKVGFKQVKLNYTILRNYNLKEFWDILALTQKFGFILQLIELHKVEGINPVIQYTQEHISVMEVEKIFEHLIETTHHRETMQNRRVYDLKGGGRIETVVSGPDACAHCTKIRLTADGQIKPCLMRNDENVDMLSMLNIGASDYELKRVIRRVAQNRKPYYNFKAGEGSKHAVEN